MDNFKGSQDFYKKFKNNIKFSVKDINPNSQVILAAGNFNRYLEVSSHQQLIEISEKYGQDNCLCESRQNSSMINLFFDYDCKDDPLTHSIGNDVVKSLKSKIQSIFPQLNIQFYVKESENNSGLIDSMHIVCHFQTPDGYSVYFDYSNNGCSQVKHFVSKLNLKHPYDHKQAYSGHLLRLVYSNKFDKSGNLTNRIFDYSALSDLYDPLKSLSSYCPNQKFMLISDYLNRHFILQYVKGHEYAKDYIFKDIIQRPNEDHLSLTLTEQRTPVCEHKSNNAVCMLYNNSSNPNIIIKCQDAQCGKFFQTFFHYDDNTYRCQIIVTGDNSSDRQQQSDQQSTSGVVTPVKNKREKNVANQMKNIIQAIVLQISQETNQDSGYILNNIEYIEQNGYSAEGSPPQNNLFRTIAGNQKCSFVGKDSHHYYTINGIEYKVKFSKDLIKSFQQTPRRYDRQELINMGIVFNQYRYYNNCNNTTNINIQQTKEDTVYDDDFDTIEFPSGLHKEYFINIINDDFQFITELYNLEFPDQFIYVYDESDKGCAMYFDNYDKTRKVTTDGGYWSTKGGIRVAKQQIRNYIINFFNSIMKQIDSPKDPRRKVVQFKLKSVRNVLKNNIELDQYLYETYFHKDIQFNNNPHYLHFQNGTFDLNQRKLIKTTPQMYNTFQIDYDFDQSISYYDIYNIFSQIMLKDEFEWLLKQLSNCLNPTKVAKEKQIVLLIGFGNNGKTQLTNLMENTLDSKAYAYGGRSQMIQAPNSSASSATPDNAGLLYKRFCNIAELDKQLPFNQQQVKILTGGEKIQARDLFKSLFTFKPTAGIFISSNNCPYIDTTDGGFINRLKVIDLKYQFVDQPSNQFEKLSNFDLSDNIEFNIQWRQGFMNLLIDYYYKPRFVMPKSIQKSINQRISLQQNPLTQWIHNNIEFAEGQFILAQDLREQYLEQTDNKIGKINFNKQANESFQQKPQLFNGVFYDRIQRDNKDEKVNGMGFLNCKFK